LTTEEVQEADPTWSPDGNTLAFGHSGFGSNLTRIELFDVKTHQISQLPGSLRLLSALGVVLGAIGWVGGGDRARARDVEVANLAAHSAEANAALVRGDIGTYLALIEHANDYTLMAPFGGSPTRGFDASPAHRAAMARFFKSGTLHQEVVTTYDSGDLIALVTIETGLVSTRHASLSS